MKRFNLISIITLLLVLFGTQGVSADNEKRVDADVISNDTENYYLTIDYDKYNFKTDEISGNLSYTTIENFYDLDDGNLDITFNYPCYKIDFKISTKWFMDWGKADIAVDETYNDNQTWDDFKTIYTATGIEGHNQQQSTDKISHTDKIAKKIAIKQTGPTIMESDGKYVHDIKLHIAPHILFSSPTTFDFEKTKVGECTSYQTIEFYSFLSEGELVIEKPTNFIISSINGQTPTLSGETYHIADNNTLRYIDETYEQQKYTIVIGFQPTKTGKITETINIKDSKNEEPIVLNGEGCDKQTQIITWAQDLYSLQINETITLNATASSGLPITYISSNPSIVSINGDQLTAIASGTATITASVEGNDLYAPTTLEKYAKVGNGNINNCDGNLIVKKNSGGTGKSLTYEFNNLPQIKNKIITFDYTINKRTALTNNVEFEVTNDRDNKKETHSDKQYSGTKTGSKSFTFEKEDITKLILKGTSNTDNGLTISNIKVELKPILYTNLTDTITFPQTPVNESTSKPLKISFAQLKDNINISITGTDASHFSTNRDYIEAGCGKWGIETINVYFSPKSYKEEGYEAKLTIKSEGQNVIEIALKGNSFFQETTFYQDGDWNIPANWTAGVPTGMGKNAIIDAKATIPNEYYAKANNITITKNGSITIAPQGKLKINSIEGSNVSNVILKANETSNATFVFLSGSPSATVEMYSKANQDNKPQWQYMGVAVNNATTNDFDDAWLLKWEEKDNVTGDPWTDAPLANTALAPWAGYSISQPKAATYSTTGTLMRGDHTYTLTRTESTDPDCGFNLLANSYTAPIDITKLTTDNFENADACIILYNTGTYAEWESQTGTSGENPGQLTVIPVESAKAITESGLPTTIASMQAFFVRAGEGGGSFTVNYENAVANTDRRNNQMRAPRAHEEFNVLKIMIEGENSRDRLFLLENEETTKAYDNGYEARKIFDAPRGHQMYATCEYGYASIDCSESIVGQTIGLKGDNEGEMLTISFDTDRLEGYQSLYLYDKVTGKYVNILSGEKYTFFGIKGANDNRFSIVTNPDDKAQTPPFVIIGNELAFDKSQIDADNANIYIYDTSGRLLMTDKINPHENYNIPNMPEGIYLINMNGYTTKIVRK